MQLKESWADIKRLFGKSFRSSFHYAVASVTERGEPLVTPIGSLILRGPGHGFYFEEFTHGLAENLRANPQVCILAVNSSRWFWLQSLIVGRFSSPPAVRLFGTAGEAREATEQERTLWHRRIRKVRFSKGYALMWKNMTVVRDIEFSRVEPVHMGAMTRGVWNGVSISERSHS